jgi:hypothetical protein
MRIAKRHIAISAARLALCAGVGCNGSRAGAAGQRHTRRRILNRKIPIIAGGVPIDFVIAVEISDLVFDSVFDLVDMRAALQKNVSVADANPECIVLALNGVGLLAPVARNAPDLIAVRQLRAVLFIIARQVAEDAAADLVAFRRDADGFDDDNVAALLYFDVDAEVVDLFSRLREGGRLQSEDRQSKKANVHAPASIATEGTARSPASISK